MQFQSFSGILARNFHILTKQTRQWCQVRNLRVSKNFKEKLDEPGSLSTRPGERSISREKFGRNQTLWLMGSEWKIAGFLPKHFKRSCKHRIPYVQRKALRQKCFFWKYRFDIFFWFRMKKIRICGRSFQQGCQRQNSRDQRKFLVKLYYEQYTTLNLLMVFVRKICFARKLQVRQ